MNRTRKWTQSFIFFSFPVVIGIAFAQATPDRGPCGVVSHVGEGTELIPKAGKIQTKLFENAPIPCDSMVITHEDPFWVKLADQSVIKVAPHSFIEIPKSDSKTFHLYRGQVILTSAPGISTQTWSSPNSEVLFQGGVSFIQYKPEDRITVVSSFNREFQFRNKFNAEAKVTVHAGEMSHLAIQEANVNPSQPAVMNRISVVQALASFKLSEPDQTELSEVVKRVYDDRAKSLTSELKDWNSEAQDENEAPSRTLASVRGVSKPEKALDPAEAEFVNRKMREHLYGDANDAKIMSDVRKPASITAKSREVVDSEQTKQKLNLKRETKRLEKEIERTDVSED